MTATCPVILKPPFDPGNIGFPGECGRPKLVLPSGKPSTMCYWHRIARTPIEAQVREAEDRRARNVNRRARNVLVNNTIRLRVPESQWPTGERWCAGCQSFVPLFYCTGSRCKACASRARAEARMETTYGVGPAEYDRLFEMQSGKCAICRKRQTDRRLAVDHDHKTGGVRGLLCKRCNHDLLGAAYDTVAILESAVAYLRAPPTSGHWTPPEELS
jgi:hypothetical protein